MFVAFLKFSANKAQAKDYMSAHNAWLAKGFDDGVFLTAGSLQPAAGGAIVAWNCTREALEARLGEDPFVAHDVVRAEVHEIAIARTDPRLEFLKG